MIDWKPFSPKALDFIHHSDARLNILHGSVRSSKTINCTVRWIHYILTGPPGDLCMVGKTTATLQRNVLNDLLDTIGPSNYKWINRQYGELNILGRRIYCVGANNEDAETKIRGATFAGALCDEANLYPESFWMQLMARCSVAGAKIFANCNPDSPYHWFYTNVIMNEKVTDKKIWHFTMDDNISLDEEYKNSLKQQYSGVFYRRFILGEWCIAEGAIYDMFDKDRHVKPLGYEIPSFPTILIGCDYGTSSVMSWSMFLFNPVNSSYHKLKEFYYDARTERRQKTDGEFYEEFCKWVAPYEPYIAAVYCDPSASSWKAQLRFEGRFLVYDADNDVLNGIRVVSEHLSSDRLTFDPSCVNTVKEYPNYTWDEKAQKIGIDKPIKVNDHAVDSDRYVVYTHSLHATSGVYEIVPG